MTEDIVDSRLGHMASDRERGRLPIVEVDETRGSMETVGIGRHDRRTRTRLPLRSEVTDRRTDAASALTVSPIRRTRKSTGEPSRPTMPGDVAAPARRRARTIRR